MSGVAVFDMNETTLDLSPVRAIVDEILEAEGGFRVWFGRMLQLSMATTATGTYVDFGTMARSALEAVATAGGRELPVGSWERVGPAILSVPPYPDVRPGLEQLRDAGWMLVSLTNSAPEAVGAQLANADLAELFDHVLSVDAVQAFKPALAPYVHAAEVAGAAPSSMWMVACHDWDLAGARAAGMRTAFVTRPAMAYASVYEPADLVVSDFTELASSLIEYDDAQG